MTDEYNIVRILGKNGYQWEVRGPGVLALVFDEREEADMVCSALNIAFDAGYRRAQEHGANL